MIDPDELLAIIERIQKGASSESDIQRLTALAQSDSSETIKQLGKYNVNLGEGQTLHIGDISINLSESSHSSVPDSYLDEVLSSWEKLELEIDPEVIESINKNLGKVSDLHRDNYLSTETEKEFALIRDCVRKISEIEQELADIEKRAKRLLNTIIDDLTQRSKALDNDLNEAVSQEEKAVVSEEIACIKAYLAQVSDFRSNLLSARPAAEWIEENLMELSTQAGKAALKRKFLPRLFPLEESDVEDFHLSLRLYLERISHCIKWGRYKVLYSLDIPLTYNKKMYIRAFKYIEKIIPDDMEERAQSQIRKCISILIATISKR